MGWYGNLYLATLLLAAIKDVCGGELPRVWWRPGTAVEEGHTIELQCQVASEAAGPAIWLKLDPQDPNSHVVLSHGDLLIIEDPRFSVRHLRNRNVYVVKIREVSIRDAGSYQCQVQVSSETEEQLRVEAAPPLVVTLLTDDVYSAAQSSLTHPVIILSLSLLSVLAGLAR